MLGQMANQFTAVNKMVANQLKSACDKLRLYQTESSLGIHDTETSEHDAPLLTMFEKYKLPLQTKQEVEALDAALEESTDFLKFFVSIFKLQIFHSIPFIIKLYRPKFTCII